jgi:hypothetical protein
MPILGVIASSQVKGSYESIATATVGAGSSSTIQFSSIPNTYKHLQLRGVVRGTNAANQMTGGIRFNNDTGNNYKAHVMIGKGAAPSSYATGPADFNEFYEIPAANQASGIFGSFVIDIPDYASTSKYKTLKNFYGVDNQNTNATQTISLFTGVWLNTNAITDITFMVQNAVGNYAQFSTISLYGIKGN